MHRSAPPVAGRSARIPAPRCALPGSSRAAPSTTAGRRPGPDPRPPDHAPAPAPPPRATRRVGARAHTPPRRPPPLRPLPGPPPQRRPLVYEDAAGLRIGTGPLQCAGEPGGHVVEAGPFEDLLRYGLVEPLLLHG